jgi:hypothetical protein
MPDLLGTGITLVQSSCAFVLCQTCMHIQVAHTTCQPTCAYQKIISAVHHASCVPASYKHTVHLHVHATASASHNQPCAQLYGPSRPGYVPATWRVCNLLLPSLSRSTSPFGYCSHPPPPGLSCLPLACHHPLPAPLPPSLPCAVSATIHTTRSPPSCQHRLLLPTPSLLLLYCSTPQGPSQSNMRCPCRCTARSAHIITPCLLDTFRALSLRTAPSIAATVGCCLAARPHTL